VDIIKLKYNDNILAGIKYPFKEDTAVLHMVAFLTEANLQYLLA